MHRIKPLTRRWLRAALFTGSLVGILLADAVATAQIGFPTSPSSARNAASAASKDQETRRELALDAAVIAARGKLFDLSIDAAKRALDQAAEQSGIVVPRTGFQSSLLGGGQPPNVSTVYSSSTVPDEASGQAAVRQKLELLVDVWKEMEAPPEKVAAALQDIVLADGTGRMIQMFVPRLGRSQGFSTNDFDLALQRSASPRILGFDVVDWAHAAGKLDPLISLLEKRISEPASQLAAGSLLIYAHRVAGRPEAASKTLESLALTKQSQPRGESNLIIAALTRDVPNGADAAALDESTLAEFVQHSMQSDSNNGEIRGYVMQRLLHAIERGDQASVRRYTEAIESAIDGLNVGNEEFKMQVKTSFWASAERECIRQGRADLIIEFVLRQSTSDQRSRYSGFDEERLVAFAKGTSEQRTERARRLLLETPLTATSQLTFATFARPSSPPDFFQSRDSLVEVLTHVTPFNGANTGSLLDLLLNEAEARGDTEQVVEQLFKNAADREDVIKLIARWMMLRAEKRGKQIDEKIAALGRFDTEQDFIDWVKRMPQAAARELIHYHISARPWSDEIVDLLENHQATTPSVFNAFANLEGFAEKYYRRQNPSAPPVRPASDLKHWCIASLTSNVARTNYQTVLEVPTPAGRQGLVHERGRIVLRYPLAGEFTIQGTFKSLPVQVTTLGLNGVSVRLSDQANVVLRNFMDSRSAFPLGDSSTVAWSVGKDTLSLTINGEEKRKWKRHGIGSSFVLSGCDYIHGAIPADFAITGKIEIPREVALIDPGLTGWTTNFFSHSLAQVELALEEVLTDDSEGRRQTAVVNMSRLMWRLSDSEIAVGKIEDDTDDQAARRAIIYSPYNQLLVPGVHQTTIYHERPLLEGERIEFELLPNSKGQTAAPVIGRLAYCLDGEKVALHWIAPDAELKRLNMKEDNRADDPAGEQLAPVKLDDNAWNRLALRIESGKIVLSVGDQDVYRRPIAEGESTLFGFFADPSAPETRIRNVVLKGDWPTELPKDLWELAE